MCLSQEDATQSSIFLYEPDLIGQIAELCHPSRDVGYFTATAALLVLDACAHQRSKISEVLTAVSANVNHGILISWFRSAMADASAPYELVDAIIGFIAYLATSPSHGHMIIGAGILPLLLDMMGTENERRDNVRKYDDGELTSVHTARCRFARYGARLLFASDDGLW